MVNRHFLLVILLFLLSNPESLRAMLTSNFAKLEADISALSSLLAQKPLYTLTKGRGGGTLRDPRLWQDYIFTIQGQQITIKLAEESITSFRTDAIVNAANSSLSGGGGVDAAVHNAAGWPELQALCEKIRQATPAGQEPCPTGQARLTNNPKGSKIPCNYIFHAVGPICSQTTSINANEKALLQGAYVNTLQRAAAFNSKSKDPQYYEFQFVENKGPIKSVAFPPISTGIFGCNRKIAAGIVLEGVIDFLVKNPASGVTQVSFLFGGPDKQENKENFDYYTNELETKYLTK